MNAFVVIVSVLILVVLGAIFLYFHMAMLRDQALERWEVLWDLLSLRLDKLPNLIETLHLCDVHETDLIQKIVHLRAKMHTNIQADGVRVQDELAMSGLLHKCWQLVKQLPELGKNTNFLALKTEFRELHNTIESSLEDYNADVRRYNRHREFAVLQPFVSVLGFKRMNIFEFES